MGPEGAVATGELDGRTAAGEGAASLRSWAAGAAGAAGIAGAAGFSIDPAWTSMR
jgi:hypothetical protein